MSSKSDFQRFGKYLILDHLVDGGMAKICRARYLGEQANKIVAIKMVQAQYSKNPSFVQMFEDELKVTFGLLHPNIAQVYDYGLVDEQLYAAMEYVDGANLKQFLDRLKQKKFVFPVEISTYIISQVSQALHYAHNFQDKLTGKSSNIIHRDISPHNIMLTYDGAVKVIDFGIAKADSNSEATQAGTIKGKLSYLAPEYLEGLELDHRYDQFAVGITLWEMLCSRKLFTAKNDLAVLKQIQACKIPKPSSINPNVPAELDEIVLKALAKDRNQRFENMDKLNRALVKFLFSSYPEFNATDLGYFAKQLFKEEITADRKKFVEYGKIDIKPYLSDLQSAGNSDQAATTNAGGGDGSFISEEQRTGKIELDLGNFDDKDETFAGLDLEFSENTAVGLKSKNKTQTRRVKKSPPSAGGGELKNPTARSGKTRATRVKRTVNRSGKTTRARVKAAPKGRAANSNNRVAKRKTNKSILPAAIVAGVALFIFGQPKLATKISGVDFEEIIFGTSTKTRVPSNNPTQVQNETKGKITFENLEAEMEVYLNGVKVGITGISTNVSLDKNYTLLVKRPGFKSWKYDGVVRFSKGNLYKTIEIPNLVRESVGYLTTSQNFSPGSRIKFTLEDGSTFDKSLPLNNERVPAGVYDATITNAVLGTERKMQVNVEENKRNFLKN